MPPVTAPLPEPPRPPTRIFLPLLTPSQQVQPAPSTASDSPQECNIGVAASKSQESRAPVEATVSSLDATLLQLRSQLHSALQQHAHSCSELNSLLDSV